MICNKCGNILQKESKFCNKCGAKIVDEKIIVDTFETRNSNKGKSIPKINIYIVIALVIVLIIFLIHIWGSSNRSINTKMNFNTSNTVNTSETNRKLSIDDVKLNTPYTSLDSMNEATKRVALCGLSYLDNAHPNFQWSKIEITQKDGYGRFWVVINYVKSSTSERASVAGIMVWVKDINDYGKMGYYYSGAPAQKSNNWGKPITEF